MMRVARWCMLAVAMCLPLISHADTASTSVSGKMIFARPVALRGTLGESPIQMNLRAKEEFEDGIEGDYFLFGQSLKILLAGEVEGDEFLLEESENGTDVSGQWTGKLTGESIEGEWQSADGKIAKPFRVHIIRPNNSNTAGKATRK